MDAYASAMQDHNLDAFSDLMSDTPEADLFMKFLEWRCAAMEIMDVGYSDYEYKITDVEYVADDLAELSITFDETFDYQQIDFTGYSVGLVMHVRYDNTDDMYKIESIFLENDDYYTYFAENMAVATQSIDDADNSTERLLQEMISELTVLKSEMDAACLDQTPRKTLAEAAIAPYATSYSYSGLQGAAYAQEYVTDANPCFYVATKGGDCTNFVSQCIWAGYGGWNSSMSDAAMQANISNKVRMVSGTWYAGSGGGSPNWESVEKLWNYAVNNTGKGPKAYGYNNGEYYTELLPIDISVGNVIQCSPTGSAYGHSTYVISTPGGSNPGYGEIVVAQHTGNKTRTVADLITTGSKYLRLMHFTKGSFDS